MAVDRPHQRAQQQLLGFVDLVHGQHQPDTAGLGDEHQVVDERFEVGVAVALCRVERHLALRDGERRQPTAKIGRLRQQGAGVTHQRLARAGQPLVARVRLDVQRHGPDPGGVVAHVGHQRRLADPAYPTQQWHRDRVGGHREPVDHRFRGPQRCVPAAERRRYLAGPGFERRRAEWRGRLGLEPIRRAHPSTEVCLILP